MTRFENGHVVTVAQTRASATVTTEGATIVAIDDRAADETVDLDGGWLVPGFVDTQVNGGGGVLFNDDISVEAIAAIGAAHARFGTTAFLPTLISDDLDRVARALDASEAAIARGVPGVVGTHIEGPFLNVARKGIHDATKFRRIDAATIDLLTRPRAGKVMLTLAPELCAPDDIAALAAGGVRVSAGHSDATYDQIVVALGAGLSGFTHLFNAMSPFGHRAPGVVGAALDDDSAWCGLIADGVHVHPAALRIAMKARPRARMMLVTDAMPSVGSDSDHFMLQGKRIAVRDGMCVGPDGTLAGSHLDMAGAVRGIVAMTGCAVEDAAAMAAGNPAAFLGLSGERGALAPGLRADWVWLDRDLHARGTWIGGARVA